MKKNNNKRVIIIISIIIVILVVILIILKNSVKKQTNKQELINNVSLYTSSSEFKTIEEVATYLECEYIKEEISKINDYNVDIYMKIKYEPYADNQSNEIFYQKLISYCSEVLKYANFRIIDSKNNITVEVKCNAENKKIKNIIINGENNYFAKHNSLIELNNLNSEKETEFEVQSNILQEVIQKNWFSNINLGTKESIYNQYDIYFDEGIEVKNINNKIFNIIFMSKYKNNIVNNIKVTTSKEEIIKKLGQPVFENEQYGIIGYKGKDFYLFYNEKQEISIYRIDNDYDSTEFEKSVNEYISDGDVSKLVTNIKEKYKDFDKYSNNSNGIKLRYSLKGIEIEFIKNLNSGIKIYNNYKGTIYNNLKLEDIKDEIPDNIIIKNENLVWNIEVERLETNYLTEYTASTEQLDNSNNLDINKNSNKFYTIKETIDENLYKIKFISIDGTNANSELKENVNDYMWFDDYNFIYSVKNKGIYVFNASSRKYGTLVTGNEEFKFKKFSNNILKYDDKEIKIGK